MSYTSTSESKSVSRNLKVYGPCPRSVTKYLVELIASHDEPVLWYCGNGYTVPPITGDMLRKVHFTSFEQCLDMCIRSDLERPSWLHFSTIVVDDVYNLDANVFTLIKRLISSRLNPRILRIIIGGHKPTTYEMKKTHWSETSNIYLQGAYSNWCIVQAPRDIGFPEMGPMPMVEKLGRGKISISSLSNSVRAGLQLQADVANWFEVLPLNQVPGGRHESGLSYNQVEWKRLRGMLVQCWFEYQLTGSLRSMLINSYLFVRQDINIPGVAPTINGYLKILVADLADWSHNPYLQLQDLLLLLTADRDLTNESRLSNHFPFTGILNSMRLLDTTVLHSLGLSPSDTFFETNISCNIEPIAREVTGRIDMHCKTQEAVHIYEIKCCRSIGIEHYLQTFLYGVIMFLDPIIRVHIVKSRSIRMFVCDIDGGGVHEVVSKFTFSEQKCVEIVNKLIRNL